MALLSPVGLARPRPATVTVDPISLVVAECVTVTTAMRKHTQWAHSSVAAILGAPLSPRSTLDPDRSDRAGQTVLPQSDTADPIQAGQTEALVPGEDHPDQADEYEADAPSQLDRWLGIAKQSTDMPASGVLVPVSSWPFGRFEKRPADDPLINGFTTLRTRLKSCRGEFKSFQFPNQLDTNIPRYPTYRCSRTHRSLPPCHPVIRYFSPDHIPGSDCHHQISILRHHITQFTRLTPRLSRHLGRLDRMPV